MVGPAVPSPNPYGLLTPFMIPEALAGTKVVNIGDGFIWHAFERLLGKFPVGAVASPRERPSGPMIQRLLACPGVILGGANQLHDRFTVWPSMTPAELDGGRLHRMRFVPMAIGVHGESGKNSDMSKCTRRILELIHERILYSSWRCPRTVEYLRASLPHRAEQFLMTGCPVAYDRPIIDGVPFSEQAKTIAVTVTERHDFYDREAGVLAAVAQRFPLARRWLVVHQNVRPPRIGESLRHALIRQASAVSEPVERLRWLARRWGYRIRIPTQVAECHRWYAQCDLHIGTRLHAHLHFLSQAKRTVLIDGVDTRAHGIAEAYGFPLCQATDLDQGLTADFEGIRKRIRAVHQVMQKFVAGLPT